jgi:hypothetical protein
LAIKVFIDQGHNPQGFNAGAEGFGLREQDITYSVGTYLADILRADGRFEVMTSRNSPTEVLGTSNSTSLQERVNMANSWGADYFISIHANASTNPEANGSEVYVYSEATPAYALAGDVLGQIVRRLEMRDLGVKTRPTLYVLRRTQMPAILVELGFITNESDANKLANNQYQFAYAIYAGLLDYLGLSSNI